MTQTPNPIGYYTKQLRDIVPQEAYSLATYKLIPMAIHSSLILGYLSIIKLFPNVWITIFLSILMGISIACLFLYSHELSHGTIVKKQPQLYLLENFFWAFSGIPPTVWRRVHNYSHHSHMNTYNDPDRKTFKSERTPLNKLYNLFIYPNKALRYSITVGFAMMFYSTKHILAVFYPKGAMPQIVTHRPNYTPKDVMRIAFELLFILVFWLTIILYIGSPYGPLACFISWLVYSAAVITFIITQHLRDQVFIETPDPFMTTTSVIIPKWLDKIIDWHSFHVEHHLFPGINFDYYPVISKKIQERFPDQYERIPLFQAIKESYDKDVFLDDPLT